MKIIAAMVPLCLFAASACTGPAANYPSLTPRAIEQRSDEPESLALPAPAPADAALGQRIDTLLDDARRGETRFVAALPAAERAISGARGSRLGSEAWIVAQQQLSALDAARTPTSAAMAALDTLYIDIADKVFADAKIGGLVEAEAAYAEVQALNDRQIAQLTLLQAALSQP